MVTVLNVGTTEIEHYIYKGYYIYSTVAGLPKGQAQWQDGFTVRLRGHRIIPAELVWTIPMWLTWQS